ncbi:MAG: hypothetical protein BGO09_01500 [Bacteroidetes bacterium 47-18]|nr:MAG: hypothetical protein BGO09_01500 [Bacteroidetes bacterium 47-18]
MLYKGFDAISLTFNKHNTDQVVIVTLSLSKGNGQKKGWKVIFPSFFISRHRVIPVRVNPVSSRAGKPVSAPVALSRSARAVPAFYCNKLCIFASIYYLSNFLCHSTIRN